MLSLEGTLLSEVILSDGTEGWRFNWLSSLKSWFIRGSGDRECCDGSWSGGGGWWKDGWLSKWSGRKEDEKWKGSWGLIDEWPRWWGQDWPSVEAREIRGKGGREAGSWNAAEFKNGWGARYWEGE